MNLKKNLSTLKRRKRSRRCRGTPVMRQHRIEDVNSLLSWPQGKRGGLVLYGDSDRFTMVRAAAGHRFVKPTVHQPRIRQWPVS